MVPKINSQREDKSRENKSNPNKYTAPDVVEQIPNKSDSVNSKEDRVDINNGLISNIQVMACDDGN